MEEKFRVAMFGQKRLSRDKLQSTCDYPRMVTKLKQQAADFICKKYNWDDVVEETMQLYRRVRK